MRLRSVSSRAVGRPAVLALARWTSIASASDETCASLSFHRSRSRQRPCRRSLMCAAYPARCLALVALARHKPFPAQLAEALGVPLADPRSEATSASSQNRICTTTTPKLATSTAGIGVNRIGIYNARCARRSGTPGAPRCRDGSCNARTPRRRRDGLRSFPSPAPSAASRRRPSSRRPALPHPLSPWRITIRFLGKPRKTAPKIKNTPGVPGVRPVSSLRVMRFRISPHPTSSSTATTSLAGREVLPAFVQRAGVHASDIPPLLIATISATDSSLSATAFTRHHR